jgi:hypothetical protein
MVVYRSKLHATLKRNYQFMPGLKCLRLLMPSSWSGLPGISTGGTQRLRRSPPAGPNCRYRMARPFHSPVTPYQISFEA